MVACAHVKHLACVAADACQVCSSAWCCRRLHAVLVLCSYFVGDHGCPLAETEKGVGTLVNDEGKLGVPWTCP